MNNKRRGSIVCSFDCSFVRHSFGRSFVRSFVRSIVRSFDRSFVYFFVRLFVRSFRACTDEHSSIVSSSLSRETNHIANFKWTVVRYTRYLYLDYALKLQISYMSDNKRQVQRTWNGPALSCMFRLAHWNYPPDANPISESRIQSALD